MQRVGTLEFTLQGEPLSLARSSRKGPSRSPALFVPFADQTTGKETYAAGRYLDIDPTTTGYLHDRLQPRLQPVLRLQRRPTSARFRRRRTG